MSIATLPAMPLPSLVMTAECIISLLALCPLPHIYPSQATVETKDLPFDCVAGTTQNQNLAWLSLYAHTLHFVFIVFVTVLLIAERSVLRTLGIFNRKRDRTGEK